MKLCAYTNYIKTDLVKKKKKSSKYWQLAEIPASLGIKKDSH